MKKIILKYFDEFDNKISQECISIENFIKKIDKEIDEEWKDFFKVVRVKFKIFEDNQGYTKIDETNCTAKEFKKESVLLKNKMS